MARSLPAPGPLAVADDGETTPHPRGSPEESGVRCKEAAGRRRRPRVRPHSGQITRLAATDLEGQRAWTQFLDSQTRLVRDLDPFQSTTPIPSPHRPPPCPCFRVVASEHFSKPIVRPASLQVCRRRRETAVDGIFEARGVECALPWTTDKQEGGRLGAERLPPPPSWQANRAP